MMNPALAISSLNLIINQNHLLHDFDLKIFKGERVAITGPSGCGKSTLLKSIIAGKFPIHSSVKLFQKSSEESFAYAPQKEGLLPWFSLNKSLSVFNKDSQLTKEVTERFGINPVLDKFPYQLSGGEYQRSTVALALVSKPSFLIADEPLTELDLSNKWAILDFMSSYITKQSATLLLVSHDPDTLLYLSDRIIILSDKPSRVITEIKLSVPHPRTKNYLVSDEFNQAKQVLLGKINK